MSESSDIFISHAGEDEQVVRTLAEGLEREGYSTWFYERDSNLGEPHLVQTRRAIQRCKVIVVLASPSSLRSHEVEAELQAAHRIAKPLAPLLLSVTWDQVTTQRELWDMIFGTAAALTIDPKRVLDLLPRIVAGLTAMNVAPHGQAAVGRAMTTYPFPIAATYVRRLSRPWAPEQAVQAHEAVLDMAVATVGYLAVVATCRYRKDLADPRQADAPAEELLAGLRQPGLADWGRLLASVIKAAAPAGDPLRDAIRKFMDFQREQADAVFEATLALRRWIGSAEQPTRTVTNRDFIELLGAYSQIMPSRAEAGARLELGEDLQRRVEALRRALDLLLVEVGFLAKYSLVYVQEAQQIGRAWSHRVYEGVGRDLVVKNEPILCQDPLERSHVYLCRRDGGALVPILDLDPLLVFQDCPNCGLPSMFFCSLGKTSHAEGASVGCGHRTDWDEPRTRVLASFLSLSESRMSSSPTIYQPYRAAVDEVMAEDGQIPPDQREKLAFLGKMMQVPAEVAACLEEQVLAERRRKHEEAERAERDRRSAEEERLRIATAALATAAPLVESTSPVSGLHAPVSARQAQHFVAIWRETLAAPATHVALTGSSPSAFVVDESGTVWVRSRDGKVVYRDQVQGRACRILPTVDGVVVATWSGGVYAFGTRELKWHRALGSPVSALLDRTPAGTVLAGTWDGRLLALRLDDGTCEWTTSFEDGLSAVVAGHESSTTFVGTYGGLLARLGANGTKEWVRDLRGGVLQVAPADNPEDIMVVTRDGVLTQLQAGSQVTVWEKCFEGGLLAAGFSGNGRRVLLALRAGKVQSCVIDGGTRVRTERSFKELRSTFFLPLSSSGRFQAVLSQKEGLWLLDDHELTWSGEVDEPVACAAVSADGRHILAGGPDCVRLYRLSAPALTATLSPLGELRKGRFTRLRVTVDNTGERVARDISVELLGPVERHPFTLGDELPVGGRVVLENRSVLPKEDGALPLRVRLGCTDDRGISHTFESEQVLDTAVPAATSQEDRS